MLLETLLTGVLSGGATGLIGIALQQGGDARKRRDDLERLRLEHDQTRELFKLEADRQVQVAKLDAESAERLAGIALEGRLAESADTNYQASLSHDRASYVPEGKGVPWLLSLVDFLRGLVRPGATAYSLALLTVLVLWVQELWAASGLKLTPEQVMRLVMEIIGTATYLATTCTVWWFGVRPAQRK